MRADEPQDEFAIDWTPIWPDEDGRLEPILLDAPLWIEFAEVEPQAPAAEPAALPQLARFEEFAPLDAAAGSDEPDEPPPAPRQGAAPSSLAASLGVHLLALLVLTGWHNTPAEFGGAIPVRLVIEAAAAAPAEQQPGQSVAENADQTPQADNGAVSTPAEPRAPPPKTQVASVTPPAKPRPPRPPPQRAPAPPAPSTHAAKPVPEPPRTEAAALPTLAAAAPVSIAPPATAQTGPPSSASIAAARDGQASGAATGQGDYLVHLEQLTRPYLYMLSPTFLAGRRGRTTLTVAVGDDGTISRIGVKHSSGYPDIDARIEQMVQAVGRFPPLPSQLRRPGADLDFNLAFPDVLQQ